MYFKHTNSLIESIVNGQIDLEATIRLEDRGISILGEVRNVEI